jgi:DHA1 family inner membrane transport protein
MLRLTLGHMASTFAPNYPDLLALRLTMLAFAGAFTPLAAGTAGLLAAENKRASIIASVLLGWALAIAIGLPLISVMAPQIGWRATYGLVSMLSAVSFLALLVGLPRPRGVAPVGSVNKGPTNAITTSWPAASKPVIESNSSR